MPASLSLPAPLPPHVTPNAHTVPTQRSRPAQTAAARPRMRGLAASRRLLLNAARAQLCTPPLFPRCRAPPAARAQARMMAGSGAVADGPSTSAPSAAAGGGAASASAAVAAAAPAAPPQLPSDSRALAANLCGYDIEGVSIAGQETCIIVPRMKLCFDIGRAPQARPRCRALPLSFANSRPTACRERSLPQRQPANCF